MDCNGVLVARLGVYEYYVLFYKKCFVMVLNPYFCLAMLLWCLEDVVEVVSYLSYVLVTSPLKK